MKKTVQFIRMTLVTTLITLALFACTVNNTAVQGSFGSTIAFQEVTPTPPAEDKSIPGTTDSIIVMGVIILVIITIPVLIPRQGHAPKDEDN